MQFVAMRDSAAKAWPSPFGRWTSELRSWRRRAAERTELARMSEAELHDIGVSSADRWAEINKPCWRK